MLVQNYLPALIYLGIATVIGCVLLALTMANAGILTETAGNQDS